MSTRAALGLLAGLALGATGCQSAYTHIHKVDDNTYYVTRVKAAQSTLFVCSPIGETAALRCTEITTTSP